jgi:hypothetical protein
MPSPWRKVTYLAVGGLTEVGFAAGSLLLVVSHQGRGVVDLASGNVLARDRHGALLLVRTISDRRLLIAGSTARCTIIWAHICRFAVAMGGADPVPEPSGHGDALRPSGSTLARYHPGCLSR